MSRLVFVQHARLQLNSSAGRRRRLLVHVHHHQQQQEEPPHHDREPRRHVSLHHLRLVPVYQAAAESVATSSEVSRGRDRRETRLAVEVVAGVSSLLLLLLLPVMVEDETVVHLVCRRSARDEVEAQDNAGRERRRKAVRRMVSVEADLEAHDGDRNLQNRYRSVGGA